ncbi:MAG TPA: PAS domain S-box protein [Thermoanaerobaculia bacterium]|jgi:PAS domain S-box-containing protein|nr:PAS domain S-box protein [Thermoanaerobaculia bacterium]
MSNRGAPPENVFRKIVEDATDFSIFLLDEAGRIAMWNAGAVAIFGYTPEEVIGRAFDFLFTPADREIGQPAKELNTARTEGRADDTRWHVGKDGRWRFMDGVTMPYRGEDGSVIGFTKIGRDITDRQRTERRLAAQLALTNLLHEEQPFEQSARRIMQTICENLGWDMGGLWEVRDDAMSFVEQWHAPHIDRALARELSEGIRFERGVGLPGRVWEAAAAVWISDFRTLSDLPRAAAVERAGMRAAFAFPITSRGQVVGAMEFFSSTPREPEQTLLPVMTLIGAQIGDFIERRHTQEALRTSEQRFRLMTETAQDAIFTIDESSTITFCNRAVERMFGYAPEELLGKPLEIIIPERLRDAHRRGIARFLRTRKRNIPWTGVELPALHRDGHEFPCEISFGEYTSGEETIFTGLARDVTERKRTLELEQIARAEAEAAREQLERRADEEAAFRHLASALTGAVEMTDVLYEITNRATHVTRADGVYVERVLKVNNTTVVEVVASAGRGAPPRGLRVPFPGSMTDEIMQGGEPVILADMKTFGRNMAPYLADTCDQCEVLVTPLIAEEEALGALVLLNGRSSGRHFREGDVIRARTLGDLTSLALRRVRLMEQEREAKEKAEAAVRVRDETLGIVSHDLRNPLTKIALSADLLVDATPDEQPDLIEMIRASARQMQRLIQDLLDVARMETGGLSLAEEAMDPMPLVREMCESHESLARQRKQKIVCEIESELPNICGDRDRLVQVFGNLIGNALKFTPERGTITISARRADKVVQFSVRDTGAGIPPADLKRVFTPYWQAKKTAHLGAGLGLAIVRGIVEGHQGKVWAENGSGGGAVFHFTIPIVD